MNPRNHPAVKARQSSAVFPFHRLKVGPSGEGTVFSVNSDTGGWGSLLPAILSPKPQSTLRTGWSRRVKSECLLLLPVWRHRRKQEFHYHVINTQKSTDKNLGRACLDVMCSDQKDGTLEAGFLLVTATSVSPLVHCSDAAYIAALCIKGHSYSPPSYLW